VIRFVCIFFSLCLVGRYSLYRKQKQETIVWTVRGCVGRAWFWSFTTDESWAKIRELSLCPILRKFLRYFLTRFCGVGLNPELSSFLILQKKNQDFFFP
jgi:hypothetical protein